MHDDDGDDGNEPAGFNDDLNDMSMDADGAAPVEDFFVGDQAVNDDYIHDDPTSPSDSAMADEVREPGPGGGATGSFVPFDPRRAPNEKDLVMAMTDEDGDGSLMYDYFDRTVLKNWAGPEHWKLRKVVRRRQFSFSEH